MRAERSYHLSAEIHTPVSIKCVCALVCLFGKEQGEEREGPRETEGIIHDLCSIYIC